MESISSGMVAALNAINDVLGTEEKTSRIIDSISSNRTQTTKDKVIFSKNTIIGSLAKYISTPNDKFQPMNANFGILPELDGKKIKDKKLRYQMMAERSLRDILTV